MTHAERCALFAMILFVFEPPSAHAAAEDDFRRGFELLRTGNADGAIARFSAGLSEKPNDPLANLYIGDAYVEVGDTQMAREHYRAALRSGLRDPEATRARRTLAAHYVRRVISKMGRPTSLADAENLARAALFYARAGDQAESLATFRRALEVADAIAKASSARYEREGSYTRIAWRLAAAGFRNEALDAAAKNKDPVHRVHAMSQVATALARQGAVREARALIGQTLEQVKAMQSTVLQVHGLRYIVEALLRIDDEKGAREVLHVMRDAVEANNRPAPTDEKLDYVLAAYFERYSYASTEYAIALFRAGQIAEGRIAAGRVGRGRVRFELAKSLAEADFPEEAETALQGERAREGWATDAVEAVSKAYAKKGKFAEAWKVSSITGNASTWHRFYAVAVLQAAASGNIEGAIRAFREHSATADFDEAEFRTRSAPLARATALAWQGNVENALELVPESWSIAWDIDYNLALAYGTLKLKEE